MRQTAGTPEFPSTTPKSKVVIIGVGNQCRNDDGVGIFIARKLKAENLPQTRIDFNIGEAASLIDSWNGSDTAIVVDTVKSGALPGQIYRFQAQIPFIPKGFFNSTTHNFGIAEAVQLAMILNRLPRFLIIYGIEGKCFETGSGLTPAVEKAAETVIRMVLGDISSATAYVSNYTGDGFVKSQFGSLRCPLSGVSTPATKFQELVASSSNSLEFLTPPMSKPFFRKRPCRSPIRLFNRLSQVVFRNFPKRKG